MPLCYNVDTGGLKIGANGGLCSTCCSGGDVAVYEYTNPNGIISFWDSGLNYKSSFSITGVTQMRYIASFVYVLVSGVLKRYSVAGSLVASYGTAVLDYAVDVTNNRVYTISSNIIKVFDLDSGAELDSLAITYGKYICVTSSYSGGSTATKILYLWENSTSGLTYTIGVKCLNTSLDEIYSIEHTHATANSTGRSCYLRKAKDRNDEEDWKFYYAYTYALLMSSPAIFKKCWVNDGSEIWSDSGTAKFTSIPKTCGVIKTDYIYGSGITRSKLASTGGDYSDFCGSSMKSAGYIDESYMCSIRNSDNKLLIIDDGCNTIYSADAHSYTPMEICTNMSNDI